jgi:sugar lactone lactonase YvrE
MSTTPTWTPLSREPHELGEGLRLVDRAVRWVDLLRGDGYVWDLRPGSAPELVIKAGRPLGVVERGPNGQLIALCGTGLSRIDDDSLTPLTDTGLDPARNRINDGTFAPDGSFWFGTMVHDDSEPEGTLWRWEPGTTSPVPILTGIDIPNGPVFLPDRVTALVADTTAGRILRTSVRSPHHFELFAEVEGGFPDGLHLDGEGRVWSAVHGGSRLDVYRLDGTRVAVVPLPASQPTSVLTVPGASPLVVVTSAIQGLESPQPLDGYTITTGLSGLLPH